MELTVIEARDIPDAWFQCINNLLEGEGVREYDIDQGSYEGEKRLEFDHITLRIRYPGTRPLIPDIPPGLGIPPPTDMEYVEEYLPYLMTSAKKPNEQYTYGERLEEQIVAVIEKYRAHGFGTNQCTMAVERPSDIYLEDPPCLRSVDTRIDQDSNGDWRLNFVLYFRSWELWGGLPSNLAAIQLMKEYMASEIGVEDGEIIANSKGLHLYGHSWEVAEIRAYKLGKN